MKIKILTLLFLLFITHAQLSLHAKNEAGQSLALVSEQEEIQPVATMAFPADFPTTSINKENLNQIYGASGLNIGKSALFKMQQAYCYLEFLAKIDKIKKDPKLAQYKNDFKDFLQPRSDNKPLIPTQLLVDSDGWKATPISQQELKESSMWQLFLKILICEIFNNDDQFIVELAQANNQIFTYVPNIETSYSTNDFTSLRLYEESMQLQSFMQSQQRKRYLAECLDWKNTIPSKMAENLDQFKKTSFYTYTHTQVKIQSTQNEVIPSPTREQILCYFMFMDIQMTVQNVITLSNAQSVLIQASSSSLSPNFFFYKQDDFTYTHDLLTIKDLIAKNQSAASISKIVMNPTPNGKAVAAEKKETPVAKDASATIKTPQAPVAKEIDPNSLKVSDDPKKQATDLAFKYLPVNSIYETKIDEIYGPSGLNIESKQLERIKKTYCFLEFLVKLEKVHSDSSLNSYKEDFIKFSLPSKDGFPFLPTEYLMDRDSWKNIPITDQEITESPAWQNFLKAMICDCMDSQERAIIEQAEANNQIFSYTPNIETAYATNDFTTMRLYLESTQLHTFMQSDQKKRYLRQCIDWKKTNPMDIDKVIFNFRKSDYFNYTHNEKSSSEKNQETEASFLTTRQITSYFMLITIQDDIFETMNLDNLSPFLQLANSQEITSNFFTYNSSDFIYLTDFITLKNLIEKNKTAPASDITMEEAPVDSSQNVVIQKKKGNFLKKMGKSITKVSNDTVKGTVKLANKTDKAFKAAYKKSAADISKSMANMVKGLIIISDALATGLIETSAGFVFITYGFASLFDPSIDPYKARKHSLHVMNKKKAAISTVLGTVFVVAAIFCLSPLLFVAMPYGAVVFLAGLAFVVGAAVQDKRFVNEALLGNPIMKGLFAVLMPVFIAMDYLADQVTTGIIEISVGVTWLGCSIGQGLGFDVNPDLEAAKTRADMEKHRSTINIVSAIIVTIIITIVIIVLTAGAGAAFESAASSGLFGSEVAASTAASAATTASTSAAASSAAVTTSVTAENAAIAAAEVAAQKASEYAAERGIAIAAREVAELAAKKAAQEAAKQGTKQAAKVAAQEAAELAAKKAAEVAAKKAAEAAAKQSVKAAAELTAKKTAREAAEVAAQKASEYAAKKTAEAAAKKAIVSTGKDLASKQAAEASAKQAADVAAREALKSGSKESAELATQAAAKQAAAMTERKTAELAALQAKDTAIKATAQSATAKTEQVTTRKAAEKAAEFAEKQSIQKTEKLTAKQASKKMAERSAKEGGAKAGESSSKTAASQAAENAAAKNASSQSADDVLQQAILRANANPSDEAAQLTLNNAKISAQVAKEEAELAAKELAGQIAKEEAELAAKFTAKELADDAARQSSLLAEGATSNATTKQAASESADDLFQQALIRAEANPGDEAAQLSAKSAKKAAQIARQEADEAAEIAAQQAADNATKQAAKKSTDAVARSAQNAANKETERVAANKTAEEAIAHAAKNPGDKAAKLAAENAKKAAQVARQEAEFAAQAAVKDSADDAARQAILYAEANPTDEAAQIAAKTAQETAKDASENLAERAAYISQTEAERLAGRTTFQTAIDEGLWSAFKNEGLSMGFWFGQAINAGFGVFTAMGAYQQDQAAQDRLNQERESIQKLWQFVENNKVATVEDQRLFIDELHKKHQVAVENQAFGLHYYSNYLNSSVNNLQDQIAQTLSQQYVQMLTPNNQGLKMADIGSSWGLETPFTYLYPSQGFITTTLGRSDFPYAQEVAQAPLESTTFSTKSQTSLNEEIPQATKLWFNQKAISVVNQPVEAPLQVEIKFRVIYNLTTAFHIGLYLGGNYHDYNSAAYLQSIQDEGTIDIADEHLAKMFVLKRDDKESVPSLGIYENEGKGWITQDPVDANILNNSSIYHMSANLNKDQLTVSFWQEDNPTQKWTKTTTVTPCDQRTFGVIFSGLAIEWGVVQPNQTIKQNQSVRVKSNGQSEIDREKASKAKWKQMLNPKFGSMDIQSPGRPEILQGHYLYTTQSTNITDSQDQPITDYVVFATTSSSSVKNIGSSPAPADASQTPNSILSLITGNVYNASGKIISYKKDALQAFTTNNNWISQQQIGIILQSIKAYQEQMLSLNFGDYKLTAVSASAIEQGFFIYTCPTTITTRDATGRPISDYLIMADLIQGYLGSNIGMPPSETVQGMVSLITGNVYDKTNQTPIDGGYSEMAQYTKQYGSLPQTIASQINAAQQAYNNATNTSNSSKKQSPVSAMASATISFSDLLNAEPPSTGGFQFGISSAAPAQIVQTTSSISQLQKKAAGTAIIQISDFDSNTTPNSSFNQNQSQTTKANAPTQTNSNQEKSEFNAATTVAQPATTVPTTSNASIDNFTLAGSSGFSFGSPKTSSIIADDIPVITTVASTSGRKINPSTQANTSAFGALDQTTISSVQNHQTFNTDSSKPTIQPMQTAFDAFNASPPAQTSSPSSPVQSAFNSTTEQPDAQSTGSAFDTFNQKQQVQTDSSPVDNKTGKATDTALSTTQSQAPLTIRNASGDSSSKKSSQDTNNESFSNEFTLAGSSGFSF